MTLMWLSFADPEKKPGTQFLGVAIVHAEDIVEAAMRAYDLEINPGGEVLGYPLPDHVVPPDKWLECLMPLEEAQEAMAWIDRHAEQLH